MLRKQILLPFVCVLICSFSTIYAIQKMKASRSKVYALRLRPGDDLKKSITDFAKANQLQAAYVVTCVGSLKQANIRFANQLTGTELTDKFEIVSLTGVFNTEGGHFHIALSDGTGKTIGGHLMDGNLVYTTAEIVIGEATDLVFKRETDSVTTYKELTIYSR